MAPSECSCGGVVSEDFHRVFGDLEKDRVFACPVCSTHRQIANGAAFSEDRDGRIRSWRPGADKPAAIRGRSRRDQSDDEDKLDVLLEEVRGELERRYADDNAEYSGTDEAFAAVVMEG